MLINPNIYKDTHLAQSVLTNILDELYNWEVCAMGYGNRKFLLTHEFSPISQKVKLVSELTSHLLKIISRDSYIYSTAPAWRHSAWMMLVTIFRSDETGMHMRGLYIARRIGRGAGNTLGWKF